MPLCALWQNSTTKSRFARLDYIFINTTSGRLKDTLDVRFSTMYGNINGYIITESSSSCLVDDPTGATPELSTATEIREHGAESAFAGLSKAFHIKNRSLPSPKDLINLVEIN